MYLVTSNYRFPVFIDPATEWDSMTSIFIGNPKLKPKPCVDIAIIDDEAILQDLQYMSTCSANNFPKRGQGTIEMLQASLKWVCTRYPELKEIRLTDKSYIPTNESIIPLPEYSMLVHGQTWYQRHFGAIPDPSSAVTKKIVSAYQHVRNLTVDQTRLIDVLSKKEHAKKVYEVNFKDRMKTSQDTYEFVRNTLKLLPLTGTLWIIPRATILDYPVHVSEETSGGVPRLKKHMNFYRRPYYLHPS